MGRQGRCEFPHCRHGRGTEAESAEARQAAAAPLLSRAVRCKWADSRHYGLMDVGRAAAFRLLQKSTFSVLSVMLALAVQTLRRDHSKRQTNFTESLCLPANFAV